MSHSATVLKHHRSSQEPGIRGNLGAVLLLASETLVFGCLFCVYLVFRWDHPDDFRAASRSLADFPGTISMALLIFISFIMALAVRNRRDNRRNAVIFSLLLAVISGLLILYFRYMEFSGNIRLGIVWPGLSTASGAGEQFTGVFFGLYYLLTGLHTLHVIGGTVLLSWLLINAVQDKNTVLPAFESTGLCWHGALCIWCFVYPLLYLI